MGVADRIRMGLSKFLAGPSYGASGTRQAPHSSLNVNQIQYASGGFSQPVFGAEISTVGAYSREGYTSRTLDVPIVPFSTQLYYMLRDEDVQLAVNHLASQITGGEHYWKSQVESITEMMERFSTDLDFDWIDSIMVKELLAFGNSVWKPRLGIARIQGRDDLMHIPISSFVRVWWDRQRRPYKYEFRGAQYQGYHNPEDVIPLVWNPINASAFGNGFLTALTAPRDFIEQTPTGTRDKTLPSLMDRKYSTAMTMHLTERRYVSHNLYVAADAGQQERDQLAGDLADLETGEDIIVGNKVEAQELGSAARNFDSAQFSDLTQGQIFKALNDFMGKQGSDSSHQYANAKTSAMLTQIGLTSFPLAITRQLIELLFQPWYEAQGGAVDETGVIGGGLVSVPWEEAKIELHFGRIEKTDLEPEAMTKLLEMAISTGVVKDPIEIRDLLEDAGLGLRKEFTEALEQEYNNPNVMPPDFEQQYNYDPSGYDQAPRPFDDPIYTSFATQSGSLGSTLPPYPYSPEPIKSMDATLGDKNPQNPQPTDPRINFTVGSTRKFNKLDISDVNAWLAGDSNIQGTVRETIRIEGEEKKLALDEKRLRHETRKKILETIEQLKKRGT